MRAIVLALPLVLGLAACNADPTGGSADTDTQADATADVQGADTMASRDPQPGEQADVQIPDSQERPTMQMQVILDRQGFTPGVVDGEMGASTRNALRGFQEANGMDITGELDTKTKAALEQWKAIPATRVVTIPAAFAAGPFQPIPDSPADQAKMQKMGYTSLDEKLAERFHTTVDTLKMLNPGGKPAGMETGTAGANPSASASATPSPTPTPTRSASASPSPVASGSAGAQEPSYFTAGQQIRVPNVGADAIAKGAVKESDWLATLRSLGVGSEQPEVAKIVVSKSKGTLKGFDKAGKLVAMYTATMGSSHDPLPLGDWKVTGVAHNPPFAYNPELFWDVPDDAEKQQLPPGPNGPVGVVWIDLSKEHYGIHGTPEPQTIGSAQSHGCVRLTNWDAARLAQMVSPGTEVLFEA